ncbi:transmembrane protein 44 isoform X2 [Hippocampus zosterae]|uniref:transmembrane protein 44 isoform X2 n=1 Tax=Hippocampus zosterae TaxID=109293 RepID=UPI00223C98E9|nr:transmembrane protein 44 isoform X2 [Hippocampus zosterae]
MAKPSQQQIDWTREDHNSFLSSLLTFWTTSFNSCFTRRDPGQSCISVRLVCLSSLLLLVSCFHLVGQRCKDHGGHPEHAVTSLYCFLGNLCGFTGAILSRQLHIQVFMGLISASLDMVNVISWCFCRNLQAVCLLAVLTGGFLKSGVLHSPAADGVFRGRRLLYVALQNNTEILGYTLGLVSFAITSTSKFPTLYRVHRGKTLSRSHIFSGVLCLLAAALYAAAILHYDTRISFLLRVMPWLLSAISGASLDLLTIVLHWCHLGTRQQPMIFSAEMESLLSDSYQDKAVGKHHGKQGKNFNLTEMSLYMDVSIDTTKQMYLREATVCGKVVDTKVLSRTGPMWDFEEGNAQWSEPNAKPQNGEAFPLQEWPSNPKPFNIRTYASCILPQNGVSCNDSISQSK